MMGGHILVSLNRLGTCLEHYLSMILDMIPFIANYYFFMIIDLSLNIDLKIHYIVDVDAFKAHVQDKYPS